MLRLGYVVGVTPAKWLRTWNQRRPDDPVEAQRTEPDDQVAVLRDGRVDVAFVRLPIDDDGLHVIPLYSELAVAVAPKDHAMEAAEEIVSADIADEPRVPDADAYTGDILFELVAAGTGIAVVPQSIARLYSRKDVIARPVTDAPSTRIALVWSKDSPDEETAAEITEFIGIVRGRTANSSRSGDGAPEPPPKKAAVAKKAAAEKRAAAAKKNPAKKAVRTPPRGRGSRPRRGRG